MLRYRETSTDRMPLPPSYFTEPRDAASAGRHPASPRPIQPQATAALAAGPVAGRGYPPEAVATRLAAPGHDDLETGWSAIGVGTMMVSVLTDMPGVTAAMWNWWFGWHGARTARYRLWHPEAHLFAAISEDRSAIPGLADRARYIDNVSYVDEIIGGQLARLAIRFFDPALAGFRDAPGTTVIAARVGSSEVPVASGWLFHQVRETERGGEMRSRFFLGYPQILDLPVHSSAKRVPAMLLSTRLGRRLLSERIAAGAARHATDLAARGLLAHCAEEMNHLAGILPRLYRDRARPERAG